MKVQIIIDGHSVEFPVELPGFSPDKVLDIAQATLMQKLAEVEAETAAWQAEATMDEPPDEEPDADDYSMTTHFESRDW